MPRAKRMMPEPSSGSMADIAFLLLTFYMMTTVIRENKGLTLMLPPYQQLPTNIPVNDRNLFAIRINSNDRIMVEGQEIHSLEGLRDKVKAFVLNHKKNPRLSDNPEDAVVSIKTDRGTSYRVFLTALDEAQAAYYEIYAARAKMSSEQFRQLDLTNPSNKKNYEKAKKGIPMNISIAEPTTAFK